MSPLQFATGNLLSEEAFAGLVSPPLWRLGSTERRHLFALLEPRSFEPGDAIYPLRATPPGLFVILSGQVLLARQWGARAVRPVVALGRGRVFGAGALVASELVDGARATAHTTTLLLPRARWNDAVAKVPAVRPLLEAYVRLQPFENAFVLALRRAAPFEGANPRRLADLLETADHRPFEAGALPIAQGQAVTGLWFVLDGRLSVSVNQTPIAHVTAGDLCGGLAQGIATVEPATVQATEPSTLAWVPLDAIGPTLSAQLVIRGDPVPTGGTHPTPQLVVRNPPPTKPNPQKPQGPKGPQNPKKGGRG